MITSNRTSLVASSRKKSAADVSRILGVTPKASHEIGDPIRSRPEAFRDYSYWSSPTFDVQAKDDDGSGTSSVRLLLDYFLPRRTAFEELSEDYRMEVSWAGDSDSPQGGFVLPLDVMEDLSRLGLTFVGNVWVDEAE